MTDNFEGRIQQAGGALPLLRNSQAGRFPFPIPAEISNWRDEQRTWVTDAILYDISRNGTDAYVKGPDVKRLFSDVCPNDFSTFRQGRAKRLLATNHDGYLIDDGVLFALTDDEYLAYGSPSVPKWLEYHAEVGGYDVEFTYDRPLLLGATTGKRYFRFLVQGPNAQEVVERAVGGSIPEIRFFTIGDIQIAGHNVRAFNHSMIGVPGRPDTGYELFGPLEQGPAVKEAILAAGSKEGGALSYPTGAIEAGWIGHAVPAVYSGEAQLPYREWLGADSREATTSLGGSFTGESIDDYYVTPWELDYGRSISLDHDFIGRDGLIARRDDQHRRQVWLRWNDEDVASVISRSLFDDPPTKYLQIPTATYAMYHYDAVHLGDRLVGVSPSNGYTVNIGGFASLAVVESDVEAGTEVTLAWGEPNGGSNRPGVERHVQTTIRATVHTSSPILR